MSKDNNVVRSLRFAKRPLVDGQKKMIENGIMRIAFDAVRGKGNPDEQVEVLKKIMELDRLRNDY